MSTSHTPLLIYTPESYLKTLNENGQPSPVKCEIITGSELEWLNSISILCEEFLNHHLKIVPRNPNLVHFDMAYRTWRNLQSSQYSSQQVTTMLGTFLGNKCALDLSMEWIRISSRHVVDYAILSHSLNAFFCPF
jgi:hypothetical protein